MAIAEKEKLHRSEYIDRAVVTDIKQYGEYTLKLSGMIEKVFDMIEEYLNKQEDISTDLDSLSEFITNYNNHHLLREIDKRRIESKIKDYKFYSDHNEELSEKVDIITQRIRIEERILRSETQRKASAEKREKQ